MVVRFDAISVDMIFDIFLAPGCVVVIGFFQKISTFLPVRVWCREASYPNVGSKISIGVGVHSSTGAT